MVSVRNMPYTAWYSILDQWICALIKLRTIVCDIHLCFNSYIIITIIINHLMVSERDLATRPLHHRFRGRHRTTTTNNFIYSPRRPTNGSYIFFNYAAWSWSEQRAHAIEDELNHHSWMYSMILRPNIQIVEFVWCDCVTNVLGFVYKTPILCAHSVSCELLISTVTHLRTTYNTHAPSVRYALSCERDWDKLIRNRKSRSRKPIIISSLWHLNDVFNGNSKSRFNSKSHVRACLSAYLSDNRVWVEFAAHASNSMLRFLGYEFLLARLYF